MGKIITVDFRNDTLFAVERDDGVFIAITPIAKALGISSEMQRKRIQNDPILGEGAITTIFPSTGGEQETFCLRLDLVNGWLFTIDESRVKDEETRKKVLAYKRECYAVLFSHFYGKSKSAPVELTEDGQEADGPKIRLVTESRHVFGNTAAAQLWFKLGLPVVPAMLHEAERRDLFSYEAIKSAPVVSGEQAA